MNELLTILNPLSVNEFEVNTNIGSWTYDIVSDQFEWENHFKDVIDIEPINGSLESSIERIFISKDSQILKKKFYSCIEDYKTFSITAHLKTKSSKIIKVIVTAVPLVKEGNIISIVGSFHPQFTPHKKDLALHEYKLILDKFAVVAQTDTRGKITYCNDNFCKISNYSQAELLGSDHRIVNSGYHPKTFFKEMWTTITSGQTWSGEVCNRARSGELYWVHTYITPLYDNHLITAFLTIRFDITEKKVLAEQINKQTQERLQFSAHLATLAELSVSIAHEVNNPLAVIDAMNTHLRKKNPTNPPIQQATQKIQRAVSRIAKITKLFKNFSRNTNSDDFKEANIEEIVQETIEFCQTALSKLNIEITAIDIPKELTLYCREIEVSQAILNLINNARDSIQDLETKWIEIAVKESEAHIHFTVTDSGDGIPLNQRSKIMESFYTTKAVGKGTGLGLSIVRRFVNNHNGKFYIDHNKENTCFVMKFPKKTKAQ